MNTRDSHTHFGFRTVSESEKAPMVRHVFDSVSDRYDLMNDLMSAGVHRLWKRTMVNRLAPRGSMDILDLAGGTGDIALRILDKSGNGVSVTVCDINQSMLDVGRDRALNLGRTDGLRWLCADAENLPIPDRAMDAVTMAFGIRNVTRIDQALREIRRVLKPGGRFLCLEFSHLNLPLLDTLYERFSFDLLPRLGAAVTGDGEAYRYLVESIRKFPDQEAFAAMIGEAGLGQVAYRNLSGGIAALHSAWRL